MEIFNLKRLPLLCFSLSLLSCASSPLKAQKDPSRPVPFSCEVQEGSGDHAKKTTIHFTQARVKGHDHTSVFKYTRDGHPVKNAILFENKKRKLSALIMDPHSKEVTLISSYKVKDDFEVIARTDGELTLAERFSSPGKSKYSPVIWARCSLGAEARGQ